MDAALFSSGAVKMSDSSLKTNDNQQFEPQYFIKALNAEQFSLNKIGAVEHNYHLHPLLQLDSLEALAKRLVATNQCRFIQHELKVDSVFDHKESSADGRSIEEVFRRIEEPGSWIALYGVDSDPTYKKFVWEVLKSADHLVDNWDKIFDVKGYIFISAPPSVVPFHIDRENNFWLQIHGKKKLNLWDRNLKPVIDPVVERFIMDGNLEQVVLKEELMATTLEYNCGPGEGVYFPSTTPHMTQTENSWVRPGDGVVVSVGFTFFTPVTRKEAYIHNFNGFLRHQFGLNPAPPRQSKFKDAIKYPLGRLTVGMRRIFRNYTPPSGY